MAGCPPAPRSSSARSALKSVHCTDLPAPLRCR